jgi:hypothetical protein
VAGRIVSRGSPLVETIRRRFNSRGVPLGVSPYTLTCLQVSCFDGIETPTLNDLSDRLGNECIRHDYQWCYGVLAATVKHAQASTRKARRGRR